MYNDEIYKNRIITLTEYEYDVALSMGELMHNNRYNNSVVGNKRVSARAMGFAGEIAIAKYFGVRDEKLKEFESSTKPKYDNGIDLVFGNRIIDVKTTTSDYLLVNGKALDSDNNKTTHYVFVRQEEVPEFMLPLKYYIGGYITKKKFIEISTLQDNNNDTSFLYLHESNLFPLWFLEEKISKSNSVAFRENAVC